MHVVPSLLPHLPNLLLLLGAQVQLLFSPPQHGQLGADDELRLQADVQANQLKVSKIIFIVGSEVGLYVYHFLVLVLTEQLLCGDVVQVRQVPLSLVCQYSRVKP